MNILDGNIPEDQRDLLRAWRIRTRQIGQEIGAQGLQDDQILSLLRSMGRITFFMQDKDFADPRLCHAAHCLVHLGVEVYDVATYVRRVLRHPALSTQAKPMGAVVRASDAGIRVWRRNAPEQAFPWP